MSRRSVPGALLPRRRPVSRYGLLALGLLLPATAFADGTAQTTTNGNAYATAQILLSDTQVYVDVLNVGETITFHHTGTLKLFDPDGAQVAADQTDGATYTATRTGAFRVAYDQDEADWDISVSGTASGFGRVWSKRWNFDAQTFGDGSIGLPPSNPADCYTCRDGGPTACSGCDGRTFASFYALVGGGKPGADGVVELKTDGMAGFLYTISATADGLRGADGRSVPECWTNPPTSNCPQPDPEWQSSPACQAPYPVQYPIYLLPPETASYNAGYPVLDSAGFTADLACGGVAQGVGSGTFQVDAHLEDGDGNSIAQDVDGTYHIVCDTGGPGGVPDGVFDFTSDQDVSFLGSSANGSVDFTWDGTDNAGNPVAAGTYTCRAFLTVGEFHYVARDMESAYPGNRWFEVHADGTTRTGLAMYWNDVAVDPESGAYVMPNGQLPLRSSGPDGISSGSYSAAAEPNVNARSWGAFLLSSPVTGKTCPNFTPENQISKGDFTWLDTYAWIHDSAYQSFTVTVYSLGDTDNDTLSDAVESCVTGTDPNANDSDHDGLTDDVEVGADPSNPVDTDGDGTIDALDPDDDGDGVPTSYELTQGDTDQDGTPDYLDSDDDGDGIPTKVEGDQTADADSDGTPNYQDLDSDGDGIPDATETATDTDQDGTPDFLDLDSDGDTVPDATENGTAATADNDTDSDGILDFQDPDDDGDGVMTADEDVNGDGDATNDDTDGDGTPNYLDPDDDDDGIPTLTESTDGQQFGNNVDDDGDPNWIDTDADGDGVPDATEGTDDTDHDGVPNYLDPDGLYSSYYQGSCLLSTGGAAPTGALLPWLLSLLAALGLRRRRRLPRGAKLLLGAALGGALLVSAPARAADGPHISRSVGTPKQVVVLWPRVVPPDDTGDLHDLAKGLQDRLVDLVKAVSPDRSVNVRPEPQRVCPKNGGCRAPSVGVLLAHHDGGCVAVAWISAPGESAARLVSWAGKMELSSQDAAFRAPPEEKLTVQDFIPREQLLKQVDAHKDPVRGAFEAGL